MIKSNPEKLIKKHDALTHTDLLKVISHVQREKDDWFLNTLMIEGVSAPFKFKRKQQYKNLKGQRVNLTYYRGVEMVAGFELEVMNVVRIKVS
jgi:hypothetical protein